MLHLPEVQTHKTTHLLVELVSHSDAFTQYIYFEASGGWEQHLQPFLALLCVSPNHTHQLDCG